MPTPAASPFKAYDIRGRIDVDLDAAFARRLGLGTAAVMGGQGLAVVGGDARATSPAYRAALAEGLTQGGMDVADIGFCGTEEVYFATHHLGAVVGIMVTASHNPIDYNGFKLVGAGAAPLPDATFRAIETATFDDATGMAETPGQLRQIDTRAAYVDHVVGFVDPAALGPVKLVVNAGNGAAGPTFDAILTALEAKGAQLDVTRVHHTPDGTFPNGIPNPLLPENHAATADVVRANGAALGVAWDGDFDRCFFFDETGAFVAGEYVVGLLAQATIDRTPGSKIVHDPRVQWNTQARVAAMGGEAVVSRTGHALIKAKMRAVDAAYGGEMSAHHYFRTFMYCDSGMIPWLLVLSWMGRTGQTLSELVSDMRAAYPSSGEINFRVDNAAKIAAQIEADLQDSAAEIDHLDGLSMAFEGPEGAWRFNLRQSNTEPLLRLNVETKGRPDLLAAKTAWLTQTITGGA